MIIWITGLSGAGKTTIGREVCRLWKKQAPNTVLVDGDEIRELIGRVDGEDAYTMAARRIVAERIQSFCAWLDRQEINAVCCTISAFPDLLVQNRQRFSEYFEVFLDVPIDILEYRARGDIYKKAKLGEVKNVVGFDLPFSPPIAPHMVIENKFDSIDPRTWALRILERAV